MRRARVILANVQETANLVPGVYQGKVRVMFGIGALAPRSAQPSPSIAAEQGFVVLFAAQLRPIKGGMLALRAFAVLACERRDSKLVILGDGPERPRLEALAAQLGIRNRVMFLGWLPHDEVLAWMQKASVLLHPSLRDSGGMVLLEAMAQGKPVVCLDLSGPGHIVTGECGFKIPPAQPDIVAEELGAALKKLAAEPRLCLELGEAGRRRVRAEFDWDRRGEQMTRIYEELS
jgi:glycosyltransferase involved in cell wall biosynthesis